MVDITVLGISLQGEEKTPILLLHPHGMDRILTLGIGPMEAFAISSILHDPTLSCDAENKEPAASIYDDMHPEIFPRPMTHDLLINMLNALGARLAGVEITGVRNGIFLAEAIISTGKNIVRVDCRPSDGVALALRCNARLRANYSILSYAEDMQDVLQALPNHVRLAMNARVQATRKNIVLQAYGQEDYSAAKEKNISAAVKAALSLLGRDEQRTSFITRNHLPTLPEDTVNEVEAVRWSALLHVLVPETKEFM